MLDTDERTPDSIHAQIPAGPDSMLARRGLGVVVVCGGLGVGHCCVVPVEVADDPGLQSFVVQLWLVRLEAVDRVVYAQLAHPCLPCSGCLPATAPRSPLATGSVSYAGSAPTLSSSTRSPSVRSRGAGFP
jgi:hypothetical protein